MLEITAAATSRAHAIAFLQAVNIATVDEAGNIVPIAEVQITGLDGEWTVPDVPGVHWNMRFYGTSEATLRNPEPKGGWQPEHDIFDRTYINELVQARAKVAPEWVASAEDPIPPGYVANGCRAFDPALIATRANVWA